MTARSQFSNRVALVVAGQFLYSAGAAITSGSFLTYFVKLWSPSATVMAWFLILPELVHTGSFLTAMLIRRFQSAKRTWLLFGLLARGMLLAIAAVGWCDPTGLSNVSLCLILCFLAVGELSQAISYVALIGWLSDVFQRDHWGRLFGWRQLAIVTAMMAMPPIAAAIRDWLGESGTLPGHSYALLFVAGNGAVLLGIVILWWLPETPVIIVKQTTKSDPRPFGDTVHSLFQNRSYRRILFAGLHLAAAQGLTQAVLFFYQVDVLGFSLTTSIWLSTLMYLIQQPMSLWTGRLLDRFDNRVIYAGGLAVIVFAMPFWFLASQDWWWAIGAYVFWGGFAVVNVSGRNAVLRVASSGERPVAVSCFRFGAGLVAAVSGLAGGYWLDLARDGQYSIDALGPYLTILAVSTVGRATACVWLLGWNDERLVPSAKYDARSTSSDQVASDSTVC